MAVNEQVALAGESPFHRSGIDVPAQPCTLSELGFQALPLPPA